MLSSIQPPSSRARLGGMLSLPDAAWAFAAPFAAFLIRDSSALTFENSTAVPLFLAFSAGLTLIALKLFRVEEGLVNYISWTEVYNIVLAGILVATVTCTALFTLTRLDGIPRSLPIIHASILVVGLLVIRVIASIALKSKEARDPPSQDGGRQVIVIGVSRLAFSYIRLLQTCAAGRMRVVGLLDDRRRLAGRRLSGVPILGSPADLDAIVMEFAVHGVNVDQIVFLGNEGAIASPEIEAVKAVCETRSIQFTHLAELVGGPIDLAETDDVLAASVAPIVRDRSGNAYKTLKRLVDIAVSSAVLIALLPLMAAISVVVMFGIGAPVLFWQRRLGVGGKPFSVLKFRTLSSPFNSRGQPVSDHRRLSALGRFLRRMHLDELPQLLNILKGEMSLVGPRPLLAIDQPNEPAVRLSVQPGLTGWAQVHGGKMLNAEEKRELDDWYVQNISFAVDMKVVIRTFRLLLAGTGAQEHWARDASAAHDANVKASGDDSPGRSATVARSRSSSWRTASAVASHVAGRSTPCLRAREVSIRARWREVGDQPPGGCRTGSDPA